VPTKKAITATVNISPITSIDDFLNRSNFQSSSNLQRD
jgi:hypothetical protein